MKDNVALYLLVALSLMQIPLGLAYADELSINVERDTYWFGANESVKIFVTGAEAGEKGIFIWEDPTGYQLAKISYVVYEDGHVNTNRSGEKMLGEWTVHWIQGAEKISTTFEVIETTPEPWYLELEHTEPYIRLSTMGDFPQGTQSVWIWGSNVNAKDPDYPSHLGGVFLSGTANTQVSYITDQLLEGEYKAYAFKNTALWHNFASFDPADIIGISETFVLTEEIDLRVSEPIPEPTPEPPTNGTTTEPIPIPENFKICHKGKTITANERSFTAHESHGDTFGACPIGIIPQYNATTSLPDPDYSAVTDIPREIQFMKVCHSNVLTTVPVDTVRYHLKHGDQQFSCPDKGAKMFVDTVKLGDFTTEELVSLVTRIMMELMKR